MTIFYKPYQKDEFVYTYIPNECKESFIRFSDFFKNLTLKEINNLNVYTKDDFLYVIIQSEQDLMPSLKHPLPTDIVLRNDILTTFRLASHFQNWHSFEAETNNPLELVHVHVDDFKKIFNPLPF